MFGIKNAMTKKKQRTILKAILRLYTDCPGVVATYTRWRWVATVACWLLIFTTVLLSFFRNVSAKVCLGLAFLGGFAFAWAAFLEAMTRQWPVLVRYTTLREDEIKKELETLQDAEQNSPPNGGPRDASWQ